MDITLPLARRCLAESLGTFGIVFAPVALGATQPGGATPEAAAWASGLSVLAMVVALGGISGAHFNPAVTIGLAMARRFGRQEILPYLLAQGAGATLAAGLTRLLFGYGPFGVHVPTVPAPVALALEATLTGLLLLVILGATDRRAPVSLAAVAIGAHVVWAVLAAGQATGGSMNPARSLGPALVFGGQALRHVWIYVLGPTIGAVLASGLAPALGVTLAARHDR